MARIPYASLDDDAVRPVAQRIVEQRGSVLHLYQMLLHSPAVAEGWLAYLTAIRQKSSLPGALRELVIMRVAILNGAPYEADHHAPIAIREGVSPAKLEALADWREHSEAFDETERAVLAYTDAMTRDVEVDGATFEGVAARFDRQQLVDLTATVAAYNMVSRFLEALQVRSDDPR
jgi:AhpD family alkylhydroperoxidase